MGVNINRGFNRVYIVLVVLWALYCIILFPLQKQAESAQKFDQNILICQSSDDGHMHECLELAKGSWLAESQQWQLGPFYKWAWWLLLVAVIAVPVVVYGCVRGTVAIAVWVWKGFRVAPS
jgi:hypothetical protein